MWIEVPFDKVSVTEVGVSVFHDTQQFLQSGLLFAHQVHKLLGNSERVEEGRLTLTSPTSKTTRQPTLYLL